MKNFNKDLFMHDKAVVIFEDVEQAKEFFKWAEHNGFMVSVKNKNLTINHFPRYCYDFKNGRVKEFKNILKANELNPELYSIYSYHDLLIKLRVKEKGETVKYLNNYALNDGIINDIDITEEKEVSYFIDKLDWIPENRVFFPSENLKIEITEQGIIVTGEEEPPEMPIVCPWCGEGHWLTEVKHNHWRIEYEDTKNCILSAIRFTGNKKTAFETYKEICNGKIEER